jgi:hypothetical protein
MSKNLLAEAFRRQREIDRKREEYNRLGREIEADKKELAALINIIKEAQVVVDRGYKLVSKIVEYARSIDKDKFLKTFGQEKFNEAAKINLTDAFKAVGENAAVQAKGVVIPKTKEEILIEEL